MDFSITMPCLSLNYLWSKKTIVQYEEEDDISQEEGKDQESIQSNTTPDPVHHMGK